MTTKNNEKENGLVKARQFKQIRMENKDLQIKREVKTRREKNQRRE